MDNNKGYNTKTKPRITTKATKHSPFFNIFMTLNIFASFFLLAVDSVFSLHITHLQAILPNTHLLTKPSQQLFTCQTNFLACLLSSNQKQHFAHAPTRLPTFNPPFFLVLFTMFFFKAPKSSSHPSFPAFLFSFPLYNAS